ncbi:MAG: addiction module protein [Candidatus Sumerlaeota bacterium]|nr:addiction module protein [Candidatus Sumerlaeota bacterium]
MDTATNKIVEQALRLPRESRALLAEKLLETLDYEEEFEVSLEWLEEIRRRCKEIDDGLARLIPADQVFDEVHRRLG